MIILIALGILPDGTKEILGIWIVQTEGAKFWLRVMNELKSRGVADVLIAVVDGLKGFPEAINAVFPQTVVQTCIVHLIRHSLEFVSWKDRKSVVPALRAIYRAKSRSRHEGPGGMRGRLLGPAISGDHTTNAIEALNSNCAAPFAPEATFIESFNGRLRDELLNETLFTSLA